MIGRLRRRRSVALTGPEHDIRGGQRRPERSYVICSTPRSGSGLLCRALAGTGVLGVPDEYFNEVTRDTLAQRWGCAGDLDSYVDAVHAHRTTSTGLFGTKLHWDQLVNLRSEAYDVAPDWARPDTPRALLDRVFPEARFVRIIRMDVDRQAVSFWRALESNVWSVPRGEELPPATVAYSYEGIDRARRQIETAELCWDRLLRSLGVTPLVVSYEALTASFAQTVERVAAHVAPGVDIDVPEPASRALADDHSAELLDRFRTERMHGALV